MLERVQMDAVENHSVGEPSSGYHHTLGCRMGVTLHQSPLRYKMLRFMRRTPQGVPAIEDWLVDLANQRGATVVFRQARRAEDQAMPSLDEFSNEELVVALCQMNCSDRPQLLRLPAQLITRNKLDTAWVIRLGRMERAGRVLRELALQALKVDAHHPAWRLIARHFADEKPLPEPLIHWSRLAEPVFAPRTGKAISWKLVA